MNKMTWICLVFIITMALSRSEGSSGFLSFDSERDNVLSNDNEESLQQDQRIFDHELEDILRFLAQEPEVSNDESKAPQQEWDSKGRGSFETIDEPELSSDSSDSSDSSSDSSDSDFDARKSNGRGSFETVDEPESSTDYEVGKQKNQAGFEEGEAEDTQDFRDSHNGRGSFETFEEPEEVVESTVGKQQAKSAYLTKTSSQTIRTGRGTL